MKSRISVLLNDLYNIATDRVVILFVFVCVLFYLLVGKLFDLQIVGAQAYVPPAKYTDTRDIPIAAARGQIFDRLGRPLAVNELTYCIKYDPSIKMTDMYDVLSRFIRLMDSNGETIIDNLPFTKTEPFEFAFEGSSSREYRFKDDMGIEQNSNAQQSFEFLRELFGVPADLSGIEARRVISLGSNLYAERFRLNHVTVAQNVSKNTVAAIEEQSVDFPGFYPDVSYLRHYLGGENMSAIVGYIRGISSEELEAYKSYGYKSTDMFGKTGVEQAFELQLSGDKGVRKIEVDRTGRRLSVLSETPPVAGDDIFLTIDKEFQDEVADILYGMIKQVLINKLRGLSSRETPLTLKDLFSSMLQSNTISLDTILNAGSGIQKDLGDYIKNNAGVEPTDDLYARKVMAAALDLIEKGRITSIQMIMVLRDQNVIEVTDEEMSRLSRGSLSPLAFIVSKIESDEITPQMANLDPGTGSAVVVDVNDGAVLAAVGYPTYDNNQFVNTFNYDYFLKLNNDPTSPMINRPFSETRAPGSTFKMISALAGLETGVISPSERIRDEGTFTKAGKPYASCWTHAAGYHGLVNVEHALEVSCNFYFYETSYRMGNSKDNTKLEGIDTLNTYMRMFGLGSPTGVEIRESTPYLSSPAYKEMTTLRDPTATQSQAAWVDGDTIRTAIGQGLNNYSSATMAKYIATIANNGIRYPLHLLDSTRLGGSGATQPYVAKPEVVLDIKPENFKLIHNGMYMVTHGSSGTAVNVFKNFPIEVGGKTGTAQQTGRDHASFGGYAPFDNPEIAVYVCIPYGDSITTLAPAAQVARDIIGAYYKLGQDINITTDIVNELVQ